MMQIIECEQGTPEWLAARAGIPTASEFHTVMAVGKNGGKSLTRIAYLNKLAGEILTGEPMENFVSAAMERGSLMVVGAVYSLDTGRVAWLPDGRTRTVARLEPPRQSGRCAGSDKTRVN